jgi:type VI secretion system protein ImpA
MSIDISPLLEPIPGDNPAGEWLRYEGTYDRIQQARREDDLSLPQGIWKTAPKRANWPEASRLCQAALREQSKDLQIAAWLLEAWLHTEGLAGLRPGLDLIAGLCTRFWDNIYPSLDPDDPAFRLSPIEWIDRKIPLQLKRLPLTAPVGEGARACSYSDWELALHREKERQIEGRGGDDDGITQAQILQSGTLTPPRFFSGLTGALAGALEAADALRALLDRQMGQETGALRALRETLAEMQQLAAQLAGEGPPGAAVTEEPGRDAGGDMDADDEVEVEVVQPAARRGIRSRAEAYRLLQEAADYLLRTEPHSPAPYLVRRAVSWGQKGLPELLQEIVASPQDLRAIYQLLGLRLPESEQ